MLGHPASGLPGRKMPIGAPRPGLQVGAQCVLPAVAKHGADRPRLTRSLQQSKHDGTAMWRLPGHSLGVWEPSPGTVPQGPLPLPTNLPASISKPGVTLSPQATGNTVVLGGRKGSPREWVFRPLSHIQCLNHQMPGLQACSQGLKSQVRPGVCLHSASLANIPRSAQSCP